MQCQRLTRSRRHKGKHTDKARRYPCEVGDCDHGFRYKKDLLKHHASKHDRSLLVTHFCEEKEDGKECDKKYTRRDRLLRHWRESHPNCPKAVAVVAKSKKRRQPLVQPARVRKPKQKSTKKRAPKASSRVNGPRNPVSSEQSAGQAVPPRSSLHVPEPSRTTYGVAPPTPSFVPYVSAAERESTYGEPSSFPLGSSSFSSAPAPQPSQMTYGAPTSISNFTPDFGTSTTAEWASSWGQPTFSPPGPGFSSSLPRAPEPDWMTYSVPAPTADYSRPTRAPGTSESAFGYGQSTISPPEPDPSAPAPEPSQMTYGVPDPTADYESYANTADWTYGEPTGPPRPDSSSSAPRE